MSRGGAAVFADRYEIQQRLGRGGMADVHLARDRLLERPVVVKVLFPEFTFDPSFVARFRHEAQAAANLAHPNIVAVYDWGQEGGTYFIVMEYVNGHTLADVLRAEGKLLPNPAVDISAEVAAALGFAHRNVVVHGDVKPGNILVTNAGEVKVADFGIARAANAGTDSGLTQAGSLMGTAAYFSPEQAQGATPDPRSDLYSVGIVMYEMVGGRPPFAGDNPVSIAYKQVQEAPPRLRDLTPTVPLAYEAIVAKLLAKNPAARYASADDLRIDLNLFRDGQRPSALAQAAAAAGAGAAAEAATLTRTEIFLSYSRTDRAEMRSVKKELERGQISVWTDEHLEPGTPSWKREIARAIEETGGLVVLLSPAAKSRPWIENEVEYAHLHHKPIYPVLISGTVDTSIPIDLIAMQHVNLQENRSAAIKQLIRAIHRLYTAEQG